MFALTNSDKLKLEALRGWHEQYAPTGYFVSRFSSRDGRLEEMQASCPVPVAGGADRDAFILDTVVIKITKSPTVWGGDVIRDMETLQHLSSKPGWEKHFAKAALIELNGTPALMQERVKMFPKRQGRFGETVYRPDSVQRLIDRLVHEFGLNDIHEENFGYKRHDQGKGLLYPVIFDVSRC